MVAAGWGSLAGFGLLALPILIGSPQPGHLTRLPASSGFALNALPHLHLTAILPAARGLLLGSRLGGGNNHRFFALRAFHFLTGKLAGGLKRVTTGWAVGLDRHRSVGNKMNWFAAAERSILVTAAH